MVGKIICIFILLFYVCLNAAIVFGNNGTDPKATAKSLYDQVKGKFNTREGINTNFISPLMGSGSLTTFDNTKSFTTKLACPSSNKFIQIIMQPKQNTNTVDFIVYYDSNFDGYIDKNWYFTGITGICSNGYIKCKDTVNWKECKTYRVVYDGSSFVEDEVSFYNLSHCFRVVSVYGAFLNYDYILSNFGGILVGAMQKYNPHYSVTNVEYPAEMTILYYGQDVQKCSYNKSAPVSGVDNPEAFFGGALKGDFSSVYQFLSSGSSLLKASNFTSPLANIYNNMTEKSCTVRRVLQKEGMNWQDAVISSSNTCTSVNRASLCGDNCLYVEVPVPVSSTSEQRADLYLNFGMLPYLQSVSVQWCRDCLGKRYIYKFYLNDNLVKSGNYTDLSSSGKWAQVYIPVSGVSDSVKLSFAFSGVEMNGCTTLYLTFWFSKLISVCQVSESIEDNCQQLRNNPDCMLRDRYVDDTPVIRNGRETGLQPLLSCKDVCGQTYCYTDWTVKDVYLCKVNSPEFDSTRVQSIFSTINFDENSKLLMYTDKYMVNGTWVTSSGSIDLSRFIGNKDEGCLQVCKVKIVVPEDEIGEKGNVSNYRDPHLSAFKVYYDYRECVEGKCPYNPSNNEEMVQDCACLSDFQNALLSLQAIRMAAQDIICSSGQFKPLPGFEQGADTSTIIPVK